MRESIYRMFGGDAANAEHPRPNSERRTQRVEWKHRTRNRNRIFLAFALVIGLSSTAHAGVDLGIDVLEQSNFAILKGKRVGLVTNQTGANRKGIRTRMLIRQNCNLVALYTPEHGL